MKIVAGSFAALSLALGVAPIAAAEPGSSEGTLVEPQGQRQFPGDSATLWFSKRANVKHGYEDGLSQADRERYRAILRKQDAEDVAHFLVSKAKEGNVWAMKELGSFYSGEACLAHYPDKSLYWFHEAAKAGDHASALIVGASFAQGYVVEADATLARFWLEKAAASDDKAIRRDAEKQLATL